MNESSKPVTGQWHGGIRVGGYRESSGPPPIPCDFHCSFCGLPRSDTRRLIAGPGPNGPYICESCVRLCAEMFADQEQGPHPRPPASSA